MKMITSPAKLMKTGVKSDYLRSSTPYFLNEAAYIQSYLKEKAPKFLMSLMEISPKLADENWHRNQNWKINPSKKESAPALLAFQGEVYRGLDAETLSKESIQYLQKNYRMLSGLYGLLKPSDYIMLYRLEMGRKWKFGDYHNHYEFWSEKITKRLQEEMKSNEPLLNLASTEYGKVINRKLLDRPVIDFDFYEIKSGKPKTIVVYTKHARGLLVRYCAETNAKNLNDVKSFNLENYQFDEALSTDKNFIFVR